jgi:hypothetical protein
LIPVFGGERFLRPSCAAAQEVSASNFKIFWPSTNCPQFSGSYPPVSPDSPQEVHRWSPDGAGSSLFPPGRKHDIGQAGRRSVGEAGDQPDRVYQPGRGARRSAVKQENIRAARTSSAGARRSARQAGGQPGRASARPSCREVSRSGTRSADRARELGRAQGGRPVKQEISRTPRASSAGARSSAGQPGGQPGHAHQLGQAAQRSADLARDQLDRA